MKLSKHKYENQIMVVLDNENGSGSMALFPNDKVADAAMRLIETAYYLGEQEDYTMREQSGKDITAKPGSVDDLAGVVEDITKNRATSGPVKVAPLFPSAIRNAKRKQLADWIEEFNLDIDTTRSVPALRAALMDHFYPHNKE